MDEPLQVPEVEEVDAVVVRDARPLPQRRSAGELVTRQAAVVGTSFVAGAVAAVILGHRHARKTSRSASRGRGRKGLEVLATRSFLVDVHLIDR